MKLGDFFDLKDVIGGNTMNIIDELEWRGAINQTTDKEALKELTENKNIGLYCGTDPTGDSLHIGDRKRTRLNSSHVSISYAVFCLKKKKNTRKTIMNLLQVVDSH